MSTGLARIQQIHPPVAPRALPEVGSVRRLMPGEDDVLDIRKRVRAEVPTPDITQLDSWRAPLSRPAMLQVPAQTVRDMQGESRQLLGLRTFIEQPGAQPDPLQEMLPSDLRRANSFRQVPEPWDERLII